MPATTVSITCDVSLPTALEFTSATFKFQLSEPDYDTTDNEVIATTEITAVANASGVATVSLWPVTRGTRNSFYRVSLSAAVLIGGVPRWQDYTLGTIRPPATGAPHELADLLAQSSGGIVVGSTIYATLADAVAAAVAAVADAEAEVALAAAQVALASAQADRASDEADRAIAGGAAQVALATAQADRAEDEADRAVDNAAAQVALASAQADRAEAAAAGYESLGNAIALAEAEVSRAAIEADRAELAADGVASLEAQAAASAAAAAVSAGIAVAAVESTTSEGATWRPEYYGATGVGNDTAALAAWLASGGPLHVIKGKTYQFNAALTFPTGVKISGHLDLIWTGAGSVPIATINDNVAIDDLTISCPTTTGNTVTIGRNYRGRSIVINGFGNSGTGAVTISDPEGLDLDLFESTGGFQRPLTLGNGLVWSSGGRIGMVRVRDYTRGIGMNYLDGFTLEGYDIQGRNALASFTAGHNGIIAAGLRNCRFGPGIIANAGEHLFRLGGTAEMGASYNNTFGDMTLEAPGGCYIKLNANAIAYDFRFGDINAVGRFASVPGGNREFLRLSHCRDLTFGICRLVLGDGFNYTAQDALALNNVDGVYIQALHVDGLGQSVVDYASGQDIGDGLGNGDVRNIIIGALTGTDLTNRTMVRFGMATGFEAGSLNIASVDYFSDGPLFFANATTVVDGPCSISGRIRKTDLTTLPAVTRLPVNMALDLEIGQRRVKNIGGVLAWAGPLIPWDFGYTNGSSAAEVASSLKSLFEYCADNGYTAEIPAGFSAVSDPILTAAMSGDLKVVCEGKISAVTGSTSALITLVGDGANRLNWSGGELDGNSSAHSLLIARDWLIADVVVEKTSGITCTVSSAATTSAVWADDCQSSSITVKQADDLDDGTSTQGSIPRVVSVSAASLSGASGQIYVGHWANIHCGVVVGDIPSGSVQIHKGRIENAADNLVYNVGNCPLVEVFDMSANGSDEPFVNTGSGLMRIFTPSVINADNSVGMGGSSAGIEIYGGHLRFAPGAVPFKTRPDNVASKALRVYGTLVECTPAGRIFDFGTTGTLEELIFDGRIIANIDPAIQTTQTIFGMSPGARCRVDMRGELMLRDADGVLTPSAATFQIPMPTVTEKSNYSMRNINLMSDLATRIRVNNARQTLFTFSGLRSQDNIQAEFEGYAGLNQPNPRLTWGTAAPTAGVWRVSDTVYNIAPTAGGVIGWVCVTAGTPGTWKTFGAIAL